MNLIGLFIMSILSQNIVLMKFFGFCPFLEKDTKVKPLFIGVIVTSMVTLSSLLSYLIYQYLLLPSHMEYLKTIIFVLISTSIMVITLVLLKKRWSKLNQKQLPYLVFMIINSTGLGMILLGIQNHYSLLEILVFSVGSGIGLTVVLTVFSSIQKRLDHSAVPKVMRGYPLLFIVAAIMSLLFSRYTG